MAGLYIHIPFCAQRCAYCDFYKSTDASLISAIPDALKREMEHRKDFFRLSTLNPQPSILNSQLSTIYIGGGTPSLLAPEQLHGLLRSASGLWDCTGIREVTLEANPEDLTDDYIARLRSEDSLRSLRPVRNDNNNCHPGRGATAPAMMELPIGFNRLSIGVQSFDDGLLKLMNRRHSAVRAREAVRRAQEAGFGNITVDLIFGIPGMTHAQWERSLDEAIGLGVQHISAYHLTIEPGTAFGRMARQGKIAPIDEAGSERQYETLRRKLADAGFEHYEISNFAKPGFRTVHNSAYWSGAPYLGIGPSAHSYDGARRREWVVADVAKYIDAFGSVGLKPDVECRYNQLAEANGSGNRRCGAGAEGALLTLPSREEENGRSEVNEPTLQLPSVLTDGTESTASSWGFSPNKSIYESEDLSDKDFRNERIMTGLRCAEGVGMNEVNHNLRDRFLKDRLLVKKGNNIAIPPEKFLTSDYIIGTLFEP